MTKTNQPTNKLKIQAKNKRKILHEITLNTNRGFNLKPEDLVSIQLNNQDIDGVHKVVSKTISISNTCKLSLSLSKHKPMISQFIQ